MEKNLFKTNYRAVLAAVISERIGHNIATENIHTDETGWFYYIPQNSLKANYPLIMNHYRGPLFVVIPLQDMKSIEEEKVTVIEYVDKAFWSYGYFWGGGGLLSGVYWQLLEGGKPGINDKEKIDRYLTILSCRTSKRSSGYVPTEEHCTRCQVESCPFSKLVEKNYDASWAKEVQEYDARVELYKSVKRKLKEQFGLDVVSIMPHNGEENVMKLYAGMEPGTVEIRLAQSLLTDLLYHPAMYDVDMVADSLGIEAAIKWYYDNNGQMIHDQYKLLQPVEGEPIDVGALYEFWSLDRRFNWFDPEDQEADVFEDLEDVDDDEEGDNDDTFESVWEKIVNFFKNLFT